ncbi:hypothetical protein Q5752_006376 [Cryptotrichosporon argae]
MPSSRSSVDKRDVYYRKGKSEGYRARSAYKLLHLDEEFHLFAGVRTAVDLCAAPGSWSQVLGQKLSPGPGDVNNKVVSLDLQPMAPLPNITIFQADITRPPTVPLVLSALGGRKADLVVCDGAPDVTGVHDLDAYLHAQLLRAALTLALTLLAPGATLVFKIFLSPLDPRAEHLRSQLRCFFPSTSADTDGHSAYAEIDEDEVDGERQRMDVDAERSGVWVRKPRSSRKGSGEAFIVCRGFDPSTVPIPQSFSAAQLDSLRSDEGTLTLESLATETLLGEAGAAWERLRAYVGRGDLSSHTVPPPEPSTTAAPASSSLTVSIPLSGRSPKSLAPIHGVHLQIQTSTPTAAPAADADGPPSRISAQPTPVESMNADSSLFPPSPSGSRHLHASPSMRRALAANHARRRSADLGLKEPGASPPVSPGARPWDRHGPPEPLPSPMWDFARPPFDDDAHAHAQLHLHPPGAHGQAPLDSGAPSPALSSSSKTDMFFATSQKDSLPVPPKSLAVLGAAGPAPGGSSMLGLGRPNHDARRDRVATQPPSEPRAPTSPLAHMSSLPDAARPLRAVSTPHRSPRTTETREVRDDETVRTGDVLCPLADENDQWGGRQAGVNAAWQLVDLLGEGAFSAVWSAQPVAPSGIANGGSPAPVSVFSSPSVRRTVAIKLMPKRICETHHRTRIAFAREVEVLRHLVHPAVVAFQTAFSTHTHHCLVVERLAGGELFDVLARDGRRERMLRCHEGDREGEGVVRRIFGELASAVAWLHEVGVVHRDIKLENILLTVDPFSLSPPTAPIQLAALPRPLIKLSDFGLSRLVPADGAPLLTRCGSEAFAAPEIIMGRPYDGRATDAWACGVVLYALVAGELPFDDDAPLPGRSRASSVASNASDGGGAGAGGAPPTPAKQRRRMMRIAKGEYAWRAGVGTDGVRRVVAHLLVRDPARRAGLKDIWEEEWMRGPGAVDPPTDGGPAPPAPRDGEWRLRARRVWDGYVLDGANDMARAESADA